MTDDDVSTNKVNTGARMRYIAIFGKVGRVASQSVIMQLISSKYLPVLLYATEACLFLARDQSSVSVTSLISVELCLVCCLLNIMCF